MTKLKVLTILGTRPEIIRLSRVMARLDEYTEHIIVILNLTKYFFRIWKSVSPIIF